MIRIRALAPLLTLLSLVVFPGLAHAAFGLAPGSATVTAVNRDGTLDTQAGSHPYAFSVHFALNTESDGSTEGGALRDVLTDLPPGLIGNPSAVPACPRESFEGAQPGCSPSTQIGVLHVVLPELKGEFTGPLYNLEPPPGVAAQFGFTAVGFTALLSASIDPKRGYGVHIEAANLPLEASAVTGTIWGTPADPAHDPERGTEGGGPSAAPLLPFLTLPASCESPPQVRFEVDSKLAPGVFVGGDEPAILRDKGNNPVALTGCEAVPFSPAILAAPTSTMAESAAGLGFQLKLPNQGLLNPKEGAVTETEPVKMEVVLPQGMTANPAVVNGLGVCTFDQYNAASATSGPGQGCPESSKIGTLFVQTPLLDEAVEGSVYVAAPHDNPFNSLLALYIIAKAPQRGAIVKQAGEIRPDPVTGQLTTTVSGLPPLPYSSVELRLREGSRGALITPQLCGTYTTTAKLYPFSDPGTATELSAPFSITSGAGGGPCAQTEAQLPNTPTLVAGSSLPIGGAYSPFLFKLSRTDGEQRFGSLEATLPEGLVGKLAGIPYCPEAAIAAATARAGEGEAATELASPSCPAASQVGTVTAGAGAGPSPYYVGGKAYLAGPYKGAPFSLVIITPAIAGPFDLGTVVVRNAIYVDESTARVTVKSDPLPRILHGLVLDLRSIAVTLDRASFIRNPTSCEEKATTAQVTSTAGAVASLRNRFQVGGCAGLGFKPKLTLALRGGTKRNQHPALKSVITYPKGGSYANIARASVTLPASEFIDQAHIGNPCIRPDFAAERCPQLSVLGRAKAWSPLLDKPLEGKVYFRSNGGERELPDVVVDLKGQVHFVLVGFVDSVHHKGSEVSRLRTTFAQVPDAPVSRFTLELKGGKEGLLVNSGNLCKVPNKAVVKFTGQNGKVYDTNPAVANNCGGKKGKKQASKRVGTSHR